jgi:predicted DNA-binding protein with PD1-like motif
MKAKVIEDADVVTYVVVCDPGDEAVDALTQFARAERLEAAQLTAVGGFERATVGWFDRAAKQFRPIPVEEQCEVLSLIGDVAEGQQGPSLNLHVVLGLSDGTTRGGHLIEGRVFPHPGDHRDRGPGRTAQGDAPGYRGRAHRSGPVRVVT